MKKTGIIKNQKVTEVKVDISRSFRKDMTEAERSFWEMVRNRKLYGLKFRRQQIIDGYIVDFYCHELSLVVEIDGAVHAAKQQQAYDDHRTDIFKSRGLTVLRFANDEVLLKPEIVKDRIKNHRGCF